MKVNKLLFVFVFLIVLFSLGSVVASEDVSTNNTEVNNILIFDESSNDYVEVSTFTEMNTEIQKGNNVKLTNNIVISGEEYTLYNGIDINHNVTVDGCGYSIDGQNKSRFFYVTANDIVLTLKDITLKNADCSPCVQDSGGAISGPIDINFNLICENVIFDGNQADGIHGLGGAIYANNLNLYCDNVTFTRNKATVGGAINCKGDFTLKGTSVIFDNNDAKQGTGQAGAIKGNNVRLYCENMSFTNNVASSGGAGAVFAANNVIINSTGKVIFANNTIHLSTEANGGAILATNVFINSLGEVIFANNTSVNFGGAIFGYANVTCHNVVFDGNHAKESSGGHAIATYVWMICNLDGNYWGLNYKDKTAIIEDKLICWAGPRTYQSPNNWVLLNITGPEFVTCGNNGTFTANLNILTNGDVNQSIDNFNSKALVKLDAVSGSVPECVFTGDEFNFTATDEGIYTINARNYFTDKFITMIQGAVLLPTANVTISKVINGSSVVGINDTVTWIITVNHVSGDSLTNVSVSEVLPEGLELIDSTVPEGTIYNETSGIWTIDILDDINSTYDLVLVTKVLVSDKNITNCVNVTYRGYNTGRNSTNVTLIVLPNADVEISMDVNPNETQKDGVVYWIINVVNYGNDTAPLVDVNITLPTGVELIDVVLPTGTTFNNETGIWSIPVLAVDQNLTLTLITRVDISNTTLTGYSEVAFNGTNPSNRTMDNFTINVLPSVDLNLDVSVVPSEPNAGDEVKVTVVLDNYGPDVAENTNVSIYLPDGFEIKSFNCLSGDFVPATGTWVLGNIAPGKYVLVINGVFAKEGNYIINCSVDTATPIAYEAIGNLSFVSKFNVKEGSGNNNGSSGGNSNNSVVNNVGVLPTGNPLFVALLALLTVPLGIRRRK